MPPAYEVEVVVAVVVALVVLLNDVSVARKKSATLLQPSIRLFTLNVKLLGQRGLAEARLAPVWHSFNPRETLESESRPRQRGLPA